MESDEGKLFLGGIAWDTTEEKLRDHFSKYGDVSQTVVMRDKTTGRPRGFGFVIFSDPSALDSVLQDNHTIDGRLVEAKRALSREEQNAFRQDQSNNGGRGSGGGGNFRTKKIFVGGLPPTLTEEGFRQYFENYGQVTDAVIMYDQTTQRPRGFGFISFDSEDAVDRVLHKTFHDLNGKDVEVKRALPKEANPGSSNRGGGYQNRGSSRSNLGSYDNRMDGNRYMQPQSGGGFSQYPGYNAAGYSGYGGPTGSYGGYGGYGMGGYGGATGGFAAPTGGYGGSNAAGAGYGSGPANAMKTAWSNQTPGYGSSGYGGGGGYGPSGAWNSAAGGGASAQTGQSPGGGQGYGNQGYVSYGGNGYGSGSTGNTDGGNQGAAGGGYGGSGYGDNNRNSGYGNSGWRSDPSQAAGGYSDAQSWQGQQ